MNRDPRLHTLSHEHHHALVLARRARRGASEDTGAVARVWAEVERRFEVELDPHFRVEEQVLLPALERAGARALVERTLADHVAIRRVVAGPGDLRERLAELGRLLEEHVRFEERELFPAAERELDDDDLERVAAASRGH